MNSQNRPTLTRGMRVVVGIVIVVVLLGGAAIVWLTFSGDTGPGQGTAGAPSSSSTDAAEDAAGEPESSQSTGEPSAGPVPGAQPTSGSEVQSPAPDSNRLPTREPSEPVLTAPLPETGTATGELVAGFPEQVLGPPAGAEIIESAIVGEDGTVVQISLVARTDEAPDAVLAFYRDLWSGLGLVTSGESTSVAGSGAHESASVTISSGGTGTRFTVYGVFRTE